VLLVCIVYLASRGCVETSRDVTGFAVL